MRRARYAVTVGAVPQLGLLLGALHAWAGVWFARRSEAVSVGREVRRALGRSTVNVVSGVPVFGGAYRVRRASRLAAA